MGIRFSFRCPASVIRLPWNLFPAPRGFPLHGIIFSASFDEKDDFLNLLKNKYMNEQKNKQQPQQDNEKNQNKSGQAEGSQMQGNQQQQAGGQRPGKRQMGADIENPDRENDPEKKINIDDDPDQTKKKVPNMGK